MFRSKLPDSWQLPHFGFIREAIPDRALVFTVPGPFKLSWMLAGSMEKVLLAYGAASAVHVSASESGQFPLGRSPRGPDVKILA